MNIKNWYFWVIGYSHGVLSLVSRRSVGVLWQDIREVKEVEILTNSTFSIWEFLGRSLVRLWFVPGLLPEGHREGTRGRNLNKSTFINTHTFGGRAYPVRHYPIAIRLRTRKGCAILCIALNPQSGYFSGAILGVRSVALLHLDLWHGRDRQGTAEGNLNKSVCVEDNYWQF